MDNPKVTSAMSVTLSIDSYQANEEIKGGTEWQQHFQTINVVAVTKDMTIIQVSIQHFINK